MKISVIILTLNAEKYIAKQLDILNDQTVRADEIIVVDSQSTDRTTSIAEKYPDVKIMNVVQSSFDHGKTRTEAIEASDCDIALLLTQDAIPADRYYVENIIKPFEDENVVGVSGRQLPREDAKSYEKLIREFNYPDKGNVRSKEDISRLGIKTFFFSDACSAIRKDKFIELGGYEYPIKTDEDLFYAAKAIQAGYKIAYCADARVYHSHNLTFKQQYERNYIQGVEFKNHANLLNGISLESEGMKMVKYVVKGLVKQGNVLSIIPFGFDCVARYLGSKAGRK